LAWIDVESLNLGEDPSVALVEKARVAFNSGHTFGKQCDQYVRLQWSNTAAMSMPYTAAHDSLCSGNTVAISATKSDMIFLKSGDSEFMV